MITQNDINQYIDKIPPAPEVLKATLLHVKQNELPKAAKKATEDRALSAYLTSLVNKPIFGFKNEVHDISQIFGILGANAAKQILYNYMISLLSPKEWKLFSLNETLFQDLQAELSSDWKKILRHLNIDDSEIESSIALLPASIIVSEALFHSKLEEVELLRSTKEIDYNTILKRLCDMDLFEISAQIAKKWELEDKISQIILCSSGLRVCEDEALNTLGKWMHMLLFFTLSKPPFIQAGLNDFVDFQVEYVSDISEEFMQLMDIS